MSKESEKVSLRLKDIWRADVARVVELVHVDGHNQRYNLWEATPWGERPMGDIELVDEQWVAHYQLDGKEHPSFKERQEAIEAMYRYAYRFVHVDHEPLKTGAVCSFCGRTVKEEMYYESYFRCASRW
ncbi:MAG: hypothetical protein JWN37_454 [Candidatus Nomurabacteria bacterium]|nr:hypothetical protein [Candidatus Nomurabacteria bacterium]